MSHFSELQTVMLVIRYKDGRFMRNNYGERTPDTEQYCKQLAKALRHQSEILSCRVCYQGKPQTEMQRIAAQENWDTYRLNGAHRTMSNVTMNPGTKLTIDAIVDRIREELKLSYAEKRRIASGRK